MCVVLLVDQTRRFTLHVLLSLSVCVLSMLVAVAVCGAPLAAALFAVHPMQVLSTSHWHTNAHSTATLVCHPMLVTLCVSMNVSVALHSTPAAHVASSSNALCRTSTTC